ncbi:MAG: hypothetical protein HFE75_10510 [Firmicutes bacterium]|nr:hypothetical protein [Bacillota bacterium]
MMKKKVICALVALCIAVTMTARTDTMAFGAEAGKVAESKSVSPGEIHSAAEQIDLDMEYDDCLEIADQEETNYYVFTLRSSGCVDLRVTSENLEWLRVSILALSEKELCSSAPSEMNQTMVYKEHIELTAGSYYLRIDHPAMIGLAGGPMIDYSFELNFTSANETFRVEEGKGGDSLDTANPVDLNTKYQGHMGVNEEYDYYKLTLGQSGGLRFQINTQCDNVGVDILDAKDLKVCQCPMFYHSQNKLSTDHIIHLTAGTYYIRFTRYAGYGYSGRYDFHLSFTPANESFLEGNGRNNDTLAAADRISLGGTYQGQIAENDTRDVYRFSLPKAGKIRVQGTTAAFLCMFLYNSEGKKIRQVDGIENHDLLRLEWNNIIGLEEAGDYYLSVEKPAQYIGTQLKENGNYSFSAAVFKPSIRVRTSYKRTLPQGGFYLNATVDDEEEHLTYSSNNRKLVTVDKYGFVSLRGLGNAVVTVRVKGSSIKKNVKIAIVPKKAKILKIRKQRKALRITWERQTKASGYQMKVATDKAFEKNRKVFIIASNKVTSKTAAKLKKGKVYYVKVRAYKKTGKTRIYGAYSQAKKARTK